MMSHMSASSASQDGFSEKKDTDNCKWCDACKDDSAWARSGLGRECRSCVSYLKYNYAGSLRKALADEIAANGVKRKKELQAEKEAWSTGNANGGKNKKRVKTDSSLTCDQVQVVEGKQHNGNFWPKPIFEKRYKRSLEKSELSSWTQNGVKLVGTIRPPSEGIVPGVIELSNISRCELRASERLPVADEHVNAMFKEGAKSLAMRAKTTRQDDGSEVLKVTMKGPKKRKLGSDSEGDDDDIFDALWMAPLSSGGGRGKQVDDEDDNGSGPEKTGKTETPEKATTRRSTNGVPSVGGTAQAAQGEGGEGKGHSSYSCGKWCGAHVFQGPPEAAEHHAVRTGCLAGREGLR